MKHLFIARHGECDGLTGRINPCGHQQIEKLGHCIKDILGKSPAHIVSSTIPAALDSSDVLKDILGLQDFEQSPELLPCSESLPGHRYSAPVEVMLLVKNHEEQAGLILVAHLDVAATFPKYFSEKVIGPSKACLPCPEKGQAFYFDLEDKKYRLIP